MDRQPHPPDPLLAELTLLRRRVAELEGRERDRVELRGEGNFFRHLAEHSPDPTCVHDLDGTLLFVNPAAGQSLGFRPEDGIGWNLRDLLSTSVENQFDAYLERARDNRADTGLMRLVAKDGNERIWLYRSVLYEEPGRAPRVLAYAQDVTDRVRAERTLKESEERFRVLADSAPVFIWMSDTSGYCVFLNRFWLNFTGRARAERPGEHWTESIHPEDRDRFLEAYGVALAARTSFRAEYRLRRADGEYRWVLGSGVPRIEADGAFAGLIGSCVDVTEARQAHAMIEDARHEATVLVAQRTADLERTNEQLRAELRQRAQIDEELARARHLESLGLLAGGIAHEFNNLLTVIVGRSELLLNRLPLDDRARYQVDLIQSTAYRAVALTQQLLAFGRQQRLQPRLLSLNTLITEILSALPSVAGGRVELTLSLEERLWPVSVDPSQLELVILALIENARDAMPRGGRLFLETSNVELDESFVRTHPATRPGPHVRLTVRDTGGGLDEATQTHIFEPFSRSPRGGLGLAAAYGITEQHGGCIVVESELDLGTTFTVYLPVAAQAISPEAQSHG
jgi:PAS domain S-box-containing protein